MKIRSDEVGRILACIECLLAYLIRFVSIIGIKILEQFASDNVSIGPSSTNMKSTSAAGKRKIGRGEFAFLRHGVDVDAAFGGDVPNRPQAGRAAPVLPVRG